jgi:ribosomal protein S18 acetylase RimI-like enzyme
MERLALVPPEAEHYGFALSLYLETMQPYASELMVWDEDRQRASFAAQWRPEDVRIIMRDRSAVGWIQFRETSSDICLQQFFIAPRRMGIGTDILKMLLSKWRASGKPVVLTVLKNNPARRLYERFGFEIVGEAGVKYEMRLQP